ncbi:hypothetical protein C8J57DRAFT_1505865 [Mycena rebaudengoi]|nr:hypothetical protein C8J57DRAFT_1505865 [Mycena rebaudengoi]
MVSFKESKVKETLESQPARASLLDMRMYGIPILPGTVEYSKANQRLGLHPDEPNDAWFAISAATLYFVTPMNLANEVAQKMQSIRRATALGILGLAFSSALTLLTEKERQDIRDDAKYEKLLQEAMNKLVKAEKQGKAEKIKKCKQRVDAIKASRNYEVDIPRLRGKQRGSWDFRAGLN